MSFHMVKEGAKQMERKAIKHAVCSLEEKEEITKEYLSGSISRNEIIRNMIVYCTEKRAVSNVAICIEG